ADLFAGAGGTSTGAKKAIEKDLGGEMDLVAINHWDVAIATHQKNHPAARHYVEDVNIANPREIVTEGWLDLLMASPECTYYSRARGGKPVHDQGRMNPWAIIRWLTDLNVRCLLVENVWEFTGWGPLLPDGRPDPKHKGEYFAAWYKAIKALGYRAEYHELNAADYGDATTRERFFLIARKDRRHIIWPEPTHSRTGEITMFGHLPKWRAAREIIDWANPGRSLLDDPKYIKHPLVVNSRRRIARGLEKFGGPLAPLYIRLLGLDDMAGAGESGAARPFVMGKNGNSPAYRGVDEPVPTVTCDGRSVLIEPVLEKVKDGQVDPRRLVLINGEPYLLDIRFRMLNNPELARAMGFEDEETKYEFCGNQEDVTRQIGNAVCVNLAKALVLSILK
ncbi:MAG: DNA cytosine methyltransferase, partial [Pseudomonadota bacterium]